MPILQGQRARQPSVWRDPASNDVPSSTYGCSRRLGAYRISVLVVDVDVGVADIQFAVQQARRVGLCRTRRSVAPAQGPKWCGLVRRARRECKVAVVPATALKDQVCWLPPNERADP